jgi:CelD/BcsL family acetyltransferase involved in cellulose biosynthesis
MSGETIDVVSDLAGLRALGTEWNRLAARFASPFLRHEWNLACAEAFSGSLRPAVHVLRFDGRIAAIAPLALVHGHPNGRRRTGVRRLEMLGTFGDVPGGCLYRDEESLKQLLRSLLADGRPIFLSHLESDGIEARLIGELLPRSSVCVTRDAGASYWVPLGVSWREFEPRISSNQRKNLRRRRRRAEELGQVGFEIIVADTGNVDHYLEEFFRVEAAGWKSRSGTALLSVPHMKRIETLYAQAAARLGILRFYFLRINNEAAAAQLVIDHGGRLWRLKIGYDERFRRISPGLLLAQEALRHACERGYEAIEPLGGAEPHKAIWTDRQRHYCSVRVYPVLSLAGSVALGCDFAAFVRRRAGTVVRRLCPRDAGARAGPVGGPAVA